MIKVIFFQQHTMEKLQQEINDFLKGCVNMMHSHLAQSHDASGKVLLTFCIMYLEPTKK